MWQDSPCPKALEGHGVKLWKCSVGYVGDHRMLKILEPWDICQRELQTGSGTSSREKGMLQASKWAGQGHGCPLTWYMELVNLLFALLGFGFALFRYFLTMHATVPPF